MLKELLKERDIPPLLAREKMLDILQKEEYGYMPPKPDKMTFEESREFFRSGRSAKDNCAGKATIKRVDITCELLGKSFTFPVLSAVPTKEGKHPFFIVLNFGRTAPDMYLPAEEIIDNGFAFFMICYEDITGDDGDFTNGLAGVLYENGVRKADDAGKIAMWAWAAQRVMDYAETLDCLDMAHSCVCGHSRLGKTAMLTAATDERFAFAHSNNSGCSGAAITRGKEGEHVKNICKNFSYWFCENYKAYIENEDKMPFDQHYLAACIAPRYLSVASAENDKWADPDSEMLTCVAASEAYEKMNKTGFVCEDRLPKVGDVYHHGSIGYHLRDGEHYFSRYDWNMVMEFIRSKM